MQGKLEEAARGWTFILVPWDKLAKQLCIDLRAVLRMQPTNVEALNELANLTDELELEREHRRLSKGKGRHKRSPSDSQSREASEIGTEDSGQPSVLNGNCQASTSSPPNLLSFTSPEKRKVMAQGKGKGKWGSGEVPPEITLGVADMRRLRIIPLPLSVSVDFSGLPGFNGKSRKEGRKSREETFAYPSWDRYVVKPG